jgi:hypothetical protein
MAVLSLFSIIATLEYIGKTMVDEHVEATGN